ELSKQFFEEMSGKHAVILGAGKMGKLALKNLQQSGVSQITVVNRSFEKAAYLAEKFQVNTVPLEELERALSHADMLISSTASEETILTKDQLARIQSKRRDKALLLIDIAVPRDIDQTAGELKHVHLYNTDAL